MNTPILKVYEINTNKKTKILIAIWTSIKEFDLWRFEHGYYYDWWNDRYENHKKDWKEHYLRVEEIWD